MGQTALQKIQNSGNIQGALQRGQAMGQTALQKIQNSGNIQGMLQSSDYGSDCFTENSK